VLIMRAIMDRGVTWMVLKQRRHIAIPVVYERPAGEGRRRARRVSVLAVLGRAEATGEDSVAPVRVDAEGIDFLITATDLVFGKDEVEPRADDRVYLMRGGKTLVYEVMPRVSGDPPWRWSDPQRTIRRVHAKLVN